LAQSLRSTVYVLENLRRTFANLSAPLIDIATNRLVRCKARLAIPLTNVENCVEIDPLLAMLSFLKMLQNDQKYGSEVGVLLWRHLTPQRKTVIWVHNCIPQVYNCHKVIPENLLPV